MKYMGSKNRIAKDILKIILKDRISDEQWYVEPFVGGCNVIDKVTGNRLGADINKYLVSMWRAVTMGWTPSSTYTEAQYKQIRDNKDAQRILAGYFGFALSYGGKFFGGWCRDGAGKRNYVLESYKNAIKQFPLVTDVVFQNCTYSDLNIPEKSIIYCDPPYKGTTKYEHKDFNYSDFYDWCRAMKKLGHKIYISEYSMPDDFICVWQKEVKSSLTQNTGAKTGIEKLFTL